MTRGRFEWNENDLNNKIKHNWVANNEIINEIESQSFSSTDFR